MKITLLEDILKKEKARGECFKLLAVCFYQPQKDLFLAEKVFENLTILLKEICSEAAIFSENMGKEILNYSNEDLLIEYSKLFVGPGKLKAPPYGSVYLEKGRRIMGDSTMEVIKIYKKEGLELRDDFKELPDHIAVELEFMYYLIYKEIEALENLDYKKAAHYIETQEMFLNKFLGKWIKPFCNSILDETDNKFYQALARCLLIFITKTFIPNDLKSLVLSS